MLTSKQFDTWITALESGKYEQGTEHLRQVEADGCAFCCLGVLADTLDVDWELGLNLKFDGITRLDESDELVSFDLIPTHIQSTVAEMNDGGSDFIEIVEWLKSNMNEIVKD